jgi:hypothetical protein
MNPSPDTESDGPGRTAAVVQTRGGAQGGVCVEIPGSLSGGAHVPRAFLAKPARSVTETTCANE